MMPKLSVAVLVGGMTLTTLAHAQVPGWCKSYQGRDHNGVDTALKEDDPEWNVYALVTNTCQPDSDAKAAAAKLTEARARWGKRLDLTEDEWADAAEWASAPQSNRGFKSTIARPDQKTPWSRLPPIDQYQLLLDASNDRNYMADAMGPQLSELGRLGYVMSCTKEPYIVNTGVGNALCAGDIEALDRAKMIAEVRADKHGGYERMMMRFVLLRLDDRLKAHDARVKALVAKDEAYGKMIDVAKQARKTWATTADPKLVELAQAMDDARVSNSNKAYAGCYDKTWAAFSGVVAKLPAKAFGNMNLDPQTHGYGEQAMSVVVAAPNGYLAGLAHMLCGKADKEKPDPWFGLLSDALMWYPGHRGPRTAAQTALIDANLTLDDRSEKIDYGLERHEWASVYTSAKGDFGRGVIDSVKVTGDKATITFAKVIEQQNQCVASKPTRRLLRIDSSGNFIYDSVCTSSKVVTVNTASAPVTVPTKFLGGVKKGMTVLVQTGAVFIAWPKNGAKLPSAVLGVAVK